MTSNYRETLKSIFSARCSKNSSYSLRAFARDIHLSPASLSLIFSGKKGLSNQRARIICEKLGFDVQEADLFINQVNQAHGRSAVTRKQAKLFIKSLKNNSRYQQIKSDAFQAISAPHHFVILQLLKLKLPNNEPWTVNLLADALSLSTVEIDLSIIRLKRLKLLTTHQGRFKITHSHLFAGNNVPSESIRNFHRKLIQNALDAVDLQGIDERELLSAVFPFSIKNMESARKKIKAFHDEFIAEFSSGENSAEIYTMSMQFFRSTKKKIMPLDQGS